MLALTLCALLAQDPDKQAALQRALEASEPETPPPPTAPPPTTSSLPPIDISFDIMLAFGGSTVKDGELRTLQAGAHDPNRRGANLQQTELGLAGVVDPYFRAESYIVFGLDPDEGETFVELEEAFVTTTSLPYGLEIEGGQFLTEFGRLNPVHAHAWDWMDQPIVINRILGPDGMRGLGARVGWLTPLPWFAQLHVGAQNANGENMVSFNANDEVFDARPIGGRPFTDSSFSNLEAIAYLARFENSFAVGDDTELLVGGSGLFGPNATGPDGRTAIAGADVTLKWTSPTQVGRFFTWQSEYLYRDYSADAFVDEGDPTVMGDETAFGAADLTDWGVYTQLLWGFSQRWSFGLRYEFAQGSGQNYDADNVRLVGRMDDPFRGDRHRVSPMLMWRPTEFSRLRLQYNYDDAEFLVDGDAHSIWFGVEALFGAHPAHAF